MENNKYDIVFLMNHYGFYKTNLYNELAKKKKILVIFLGETSIIRNNDFFKGTQNYDIKLLNEGPFENRNVRKSCLKLMRFLKTIEYSLIVTMAWSTLEDILTVFLSNKRKNGLLCESSIYESSISGVKGVIKKMVIHRCNFAFVSGTPHKELFKKLKFKGKIIVTGGVGVINQPVKIEKKPSDVLRYLTIARLSPEKNLGLLIDVFNKLKKPLTIVGKGALKNELSSKAHSNIKFIEEMDNEKLNQLYAETDVFILPSSSEPWGLVIDEAIYYGVPVIVSDKIGCKIDLVENINTGLIFQFDSEEDLIDKIEVMEKNYEYYSDNVKHLDFNRLISNQIDSFINIVDNKID